MATPTTELSAPDRVLIIKPSSLGDVVTAMPVLRGLRRTFPGAHLGWLINTALSPLIESDSDLNEAIYFDRKYLGWWWRSPGAWRALRRLTRKLHTESFDWVIDLQGLFRSGWFARAARAPVRAGFADAREGAAGFYTHSVQVQARHTVERNIELAKELGIDARPDDFSLQVPPAGREFADNFRRENNLPEGGFLICVPTTRWRTKLYPIRHWRKVVAAMQRELPVVLLGGPGEEKTCSAVADGVEGRVINLAGKTSIPQMVGIIASSAGVICSDSAAMNIAPAVSVDVVVVVGPTRIEHTGPFRRGQVIVAQVPCQGCRKKTCRHITCMESIDPADVISAANQMLTGRSR